MLKVELLIQAEDGVGKVTCWLTTLLIYNESK